MNVKKEKDDSVNDERHEKSKSNVCEATDGTSCACPGQKLQNTCEEEGKSYRDSEEIIDSWTWGEQPSITELEEAVHSLIAEQLELVNEASKSTPSSVRLHQRLLVLERYYIAYTSSSNTPFGSDALHKDDKKNSINRQKKNST